MIIDEILFKIESSIYCIELLDNTALYLQIII